MKVRLVIRDDIESQDTLREIVTAIRPYVTDNVTVEVWEILESSRDPQGGGVEKAVQIWHGGELR